jgi:hypothetical protein
MIRTAANAIVLTRGRKVIQIRAGEEFNFTDSEIAMLAPQKAFRRLPDEPSAVGFNPWPTPAAQAAVTDE